MKKLKKLVAVLCCMFFVSSVINAFAYTTLYESIKQTPISLGMVHKQYSILTDSGWITANTIEADMSNSHIAFDVLIPDNGIQNLVTTKNLASQNNAVAAINADFFAWANEAGKGSPIGVVVKDGKLISTPAPTDKMVSFYESINNIFKAEHLGLNITLTAPNGESLRVYGLNKYSDLSQPHIYDRGFGKTFVSKYPNIVKVVVVNDIVQQITDEMGEIEIPENGYILACLPDRTSFVADNLNVGDKLERIMYLYPGIANIKNAVGAGTMLVKDASPTPITHGDNARNPRTAIGTDQTGKKLFLITVDGRQSSSIGMTLKELQNFMIHIGVYTGVNLDGGGSTTMVARALGEETVSVLNSVSDRSERAVANAVGIVPTMPKGPLYGLNIKPEHQNVFVGTGVKLWANGYDSYYNPVQFDASKIQFSSDFGYFNGNTFIPTQIGTVTVNGNLDGAAGTVTLRALDIPYALTITPSVIDLTKNDSCQITVTGKDKDGYSAPISLSDLNITLDSSSAIIEGNTIKKTGNNNSVLKVEFGDVAAHALVKTSDSASLPTVPNNIYLQDPQKTSGENIDGFKFAVFGNMEKPKTLIETILASKALSELKKADLITFVGPADADMISPISNKVFSAKNYSMEVKGDSAFIILNNRNGGLKDSVASQWPWFVEKCNSLEQNNLFVILQNEVNSGFKDSRELDAFYSVLEGVVNKGKNVYLISSDWTTNSQRRNGIRYITTGGILGTQFYNSLLDHIVSTKYILITISENGVTYELKNLY